MATRGRPRKSPVGADRPLLDGITDPDDPGIVPASETDHRDFSPAPPLRRLPDPPPRADRLLNCGDVADCYREDADIVLHPGEVSLFLKSVPANSVKLVITSPPYNIGKQYETKTAIDLYLDEQDQIIDDLYRILSPDGNLCWQVGNYVEDGEIFPLDVYFYPLFKRRGFQLRNRMIWHFAHGLHASKRFSGRYETLLWFSKGEHYTFNLDSVRVPSKYPGKTHFKGPKRGEPSGNPLGKNPSDFWECIAAEWEEGVWEIPNVKANHPEKTLHPCQFPVELVERCVLALTNAGDRVFDPYCGVGSTLIAGMKHDRRVLGSERDAAYVKIAHKRIRDFQAGVLKIRPMGKPVHQPSGREKVARPPWSAGAPKMSGET